MSNLINPILYSNLQIYTDSNRKKTTLTKMFNKFNVNYHSFRDSSIYRTHLEHTLNKDQELLNLFNSLMNKKSFSLFRSNKNLDTNLQNFLIQLNTRINQLNNYSQLLKVNPLIYFHLLDLLFSEIILKYTQLDPTIAKLVDELKKNIYLKSINILALLYEKYIINVNIIKAKRKKLNGVHLKNIPNNELKERKNNFTSANNFKNTEINIQTLVKIKTECSNLYKEFIFIYEIYNKYITIISNHQNTSIKEKIKEFMDKLKRFNKLLQ